MKPILKVPVLLASIVFFAGCSDSSTQPAAKTPAEIEAMKKQMEENQKMMMEKMGGAGPAKAADGDATGDMPKEGDDASKDKPDSDDEKPKEE